MSELLDHSKPEVKAREAEDVFGFITRYVELHRKPPTLRQCCDGTKLNEYRVQRAVARLRRLNRLSQSSLRPVQKATLQRWYKQT
jgi:hypothetical protein